MVNAVNRHLKDIEDHPLNQNHHIAGSVKQMTLNPARLSRDRQSERERISSNYRRFIKMHSFMCSQEYSQQPL